MTKIETKAQYDWAVKRVEELLPLVTDETPLDNPHSIELELLSNLVADYSEEHFALGEPTLVDVLKLRMYEMGLNQKSLAKLIGVSPSRLSDYISGKENRPFLSVFTTFNPSVTITPASGLSPLSTMPD